MRRPIIGGNWKMHTDRSSAQLLARGVADAACDGCDVVVFPPFPWISDVAGVLEGENVAVGAQDLWHEADGAFTGEVSASMLLDAGANWVLVGHSERRHVIGEGDDLVADKAAAAQAAGLNVVLCVGETLEQREAGSTLDVVLGQVSAGTEGLTPDRLVIAYEPVWAIGTSRRAEPADAQEVHAAIRETVSGQHDADSASALRIQYGGSMTGSNAAAILSCPDVDGGLVGGASLDVNEFAAIINAASEQTRAPRVNS